MLAASAFLVLLSAGCASYHAQPLLPAEQSTRAPAVDLDRIVARAADLDHSLLPPVTINLADGLSPSEAAVLAVLANPDLVAVRDAHGEVAAQVIAAGLLPNPVIGYEVDRPRGPGSAGTVDATNLTAELPLTALITRTAATAAARADLEAVDLGIAWREWLTAQQAKLAVTRLALLQNRLALLADEVTFEQQTVDVLARAMAQGDATVQDLGVHRTALEDLVQRSGDLAREVNNARSLLNRLLGMPPGWSVPVHLSGDTTLVWPALPGRDRLVSQALVSRLDLRALRTGYAAQESRLRRAIAAQFPSFSLGLSRQRNESGLKFLGGFITLDVPLFDRHQDEIALGRATRTRLRHEYQARLASLRADVARLSAADSLLARQQEAAAQGIAHLQDLEGAEHTGVLDGDVDRLAYQDVRSSLLDIRLQAEALYQARAEIRIALESTVGARIPR